MSERDERGRFAVGNAGGPGRPRRAIESEYLAVISEAVTLDDWRQIVAHAVDAAKQGDEKSRAWLTRYLIGESPITLTELLARELLDIDGNIEALAKVDEISAVSGPFGWDTPKTFVERARDVQKGIAEQEAAEKRKAQREARKAAAQTTLPNDESPTA